MRAVIAVPWRAGVPSRERNWAHVREHLVRLRLPVYTGDSDPSQPFNRSEARNRAVESAGDWDVVLFVDADTLFEHGAMEEAIGVAYHHDFPRSRASGTWTSTR